MASDFLSQLVDALGTSQQIDKSLAPHIEKLQQVAGNEYPAAIDSILRQYDDGQITAKMLKDQFAGHGWAVDGGLNTKYGIKIYPLNGGKVIYTD